MTLRDVSFVQQILRAGVNYRSVDRSIMRNSKSRFFFFKSR